MFGVADYGAFVFAVIVFLAIPGPGNLALLTSTAKGGLRGGLAAAIGVILGDQVLMWLAVGGLAAVLQASPHLFSGIQWLGAAYLGWLGIRMLLAKPGDPPKLHITAGHYVRQAMAITLLNPKAIMFYMAFLAQFIEPTAPQFPQFMILMASSTVIVALVLGGYALVAARLGARLQSLNARKRMGYAGGSCLLGGSVLMAATR